MGKSLLKSISQIVATLLIILVFSACSNNVKQVNISSDPDTENNEGLLATPPENGDGLLGAQEDDVEKDEQFISEDEKWGRVAEGMLGTHGELVKTYDGYLGYGYNMITAAYYNQKDINSAHPVVDMNALAKKDLVYVEEEKANFTDPKKIIHSSTKEYAQELAANASVRGNFPLSGSFKTNFKIDTSYQMTSDQRLVTLQSNLETRKDYILENSAELLADHLMQGFINSVKKLSADESDVTIAEFVKKYGTHVLTNVTMGGRFDLNYLYTKKSTDQKTDVEASLQASYRYVSGSASSKDSETKKEIEENSSIHIKTYGGSVTVDPGSIEKAMADYKEWSTKVQDGHITLVDASEVIPIWEIIAEMENGKYIAQSEAVRKYCEKKAAEVSNDFKNTIGVKTNTVYISEVYIGSGKTAEEAKNALRNKGILEHHIVNLDLNKNAGGKWIFLGYKTSGAKDHAITHLVADYYSKEQSKDITYKGWNMKALTNDLNEGAGGKYIYLYYTRDPKAGEPITEIKSQDGGAFEYGNADGYKAIRCVTNEEAMNFNMGTEGNNLYLWYK